MFIQDHTVIWAARLSNYLKQLKTITVRAGLLRGSKELFQIVPSKNKTINATFVKILSFT